MPKLINVEIDEHGDATVTMEGFHGKGCQRLQKAFNVALGKASVPHNVLVLRLWPEPLSIFPVHLAHLDRLARSVALKVQRT